MYRFIGICLLFVGSYSYAAIYKQSGRAKVYRGPEGEVVTMIPLNLNGTEIDVESKALIHTENTLGPSNGKSVVYEMMGKNILAFHIGFHRQVKDSKGTDQMREYDVLSFITNGDQKYWQYEDFIPTKPGENIANILRLTYDDELSKKVDAKKMIQGAHDFDSNSLNW